jgi:cytochrome c551/c552
MSSMRKTAALVLALFACSAQAQQGSARFDGIGRAATPTEVAAWDIDVRPDFKGLPPGSGSVAKGQQVWEAKCASCHGVFGEANEIFNPLVGGTTPDDIKSGTVATLKRRDYPGRTTFMKLQHVSTLWDYIRRAMPWNEPKTLSTEEVYAVTAYMLHLAEIVPQDFTLSHANMAQVQQRIPNRNGFSAQHGLWPGREFGGSGKPDANGSLCMKNCEPSGKTLSLAPDHARALHGNLAEQNRLVGAQRGAATIVAAAPPPAAPAASVASAQALLQKHNCTACHAADSKLVGPSWADIGRKHKGKAAYLEGKIRSGGAGVWGAIPMPPQTLSEEEAGRIAAWLAQGLSR